ncbi:F-box protein At2g26160-like [Lycium ferocissimum]|uniref:F-box protein At2g26160-like n=1 Tax=Lycium ferocissimum TaxID=112874 RepID=UPI0028154FC6|nr:F-box protein At2g26160-like [Lycium ferocissimum]
MAQEMADWSELQYDLLVLIAARFNLIEDYLNFGAVCKSWHSVATKNNFNNDLPRASWLILAEEEDEGNSFRKFFSLYNGMILKKRIPKPSRKRCMESTGWLITVGEDEGEISLLHPFSGVQIELPHQNTTEVYKDHRTGWLMSFIRKAVLSANPSHTSDYVLVVIEGGMRFLSFWRPGDLRWTRVRWEGTNHERLADLVYFNGQIYAVDYCSQVLVCDVADFVGPEPTKSHIITQIPPKPGDYREHLYIVESLGSLFVIVRYGVQFRAIKDDSDRIPLTLIPAERIEEQEEELTYGTTNFRVFQVNLATCKVTQTRELGERAFFLGANSSLSVQASQFPGIKPNHIYFTDDFFESYLGFAEGGGLDMGVCNLADGSIQLHYEGVSLSPVCPPTWVTPTLY